MASIRSKPTNFSNGALTLFSLFVFVAFFACQGGEKAGTIAKYKGRGLTKSDLVNWFPNLSQTQLANPALVNTKKRSRRRANKSGVRLFMKLIALLLKSVYFFLDQFDLLLNKFRLRRLDLILNRLGI